MGKKESQANDGGCKRKASDGVDQGTGEGWRRAGDGQVIGKCERQASDEGEQEAGEWWGRARHRRMMGKSERQANDGEEQERHATDGGVG